MSKVCVLSGAGGFIASHCLSHLLVNTDWKVICFDSWHHKGISERITENKHYQNNLDRVEVYTQDLTCPISNILIGKIGKINYVINFASQSHVDRSIIDPIPFVRNNVDIALQMLEYARLAKPEKFIQIGTDEVYGPTDGVHNHPEWSPILPSNPYSASKASQDAIAIAYWRTYGVPVILTNIMNTFGETQDHEKFIPMVIRKILLGETVTIHSDATKTISGARFWLHARNTSDALLFMLRNIPAPLYPRSNRPERFNIVGGKQISNLDMARLISNIMKGNLKYDMVDANTSRPGHDAFYGLSGEKLSNYGHEFPKNLEESLEKTIKWTVDNPRWIGL